MVSVRALNKPVPPMSSRDQGGIKPQRRRSIRGRPSRIRITGADREGAMFQEADHPSPDPGSTLNSDAISSTLASSAYLPHMGVEVNRIRCSGPLDSRRGASSESRPKGGFADTV